MTTATIVKFNPYMGDYDVTVLRILAGLYVATITPGAAFNVAMEDMRDWCYVDYMGNCTQRGRDYIYHYGDRYKVVAV